MTDTPEKIQEKDDSTVKIRSRYFFISYVVTQGRENPTIKFNHTYAMSYAGHYLHLNWVIQRIKEKEANIEVNKDANLDDFNVVVLNMNELSYADYDDSVNGGKTLMSLLPLEKELSPLVEENKPLEEGTK